MGPSYSRQSVRAKSELLLLILRKGEGVLHRPDTLPDSILCRMHDGPLQEDRQNRSDNPPAAGAVRVPNLHRALSSRDTHRPGPMRSRGQLCLVRRIQRLVTQPDVHTGTLTFLELSVTLYAFVDAVNRASKSGPAILRSCLTPKRR